MKKILLLSFIFILLINPYDAQAQFLPLARTSSKSPPEMIPVQTLKENTTGTKSAEVTPLLKTIGLLENKTYIILLEHLRVAGTRLESIAKRLISREEKVKKNGTKMTKTAEEQKKINQLINNIKNEITNLSSPDINKRSTAEVKSDISSVVEKLNQVLVSEKAVLTELKQYSKTASPSGTVSKK